MTFKIFEASDSALRAALVDWQVLHGLVLFFPPGVPDIHGNVSEKMRFLAVSNEAGFAALEELLAQHA